MNAGRAAAVLCVQTHPAARRRRAQRVAMLVQPAARTALPAVPDLGRSQDAGARRAERCANRRARMRALAVAPRAVRFLVVLKFHRLWRRWRRGVPFSRLWCAPARLHAQPSSPLGEPRQLKRSPRPVGVHPLRDLSVAAGRRPMSSHRRVIDR